MKCKSFPSCSLDCPNCSEYVEDNKPKNEMLEYIEELEADNYLASNEFHELQCFGG